MIPSVFDSAQSVSVSPWIVFDEMNWDKLVKNHRLRSYRKGQAVYYQEGSENCVYLVKRGRVNVSATNSQGKIHSLYVADAGCLFGENFCYKIGGSTTQASANCDTDIYAIPTDEFVERVTRDADLMDNLVHTLVRKVQVLTYHIEQLTFNDSFTKVKNVLLALADTYGQVDEGGVVINMRFTHQEVAGMASVSRVTATNAMSAMQKAGVLSRRKGCAYIQDLVAFQNFAVEHRMPL